MLTLALDITSAKFPSTNEIYDFGEIPQPLSQCQFPDFESIVVRMCNRVLNNTWHVAGSCNTSILNMNILKTEDRNKQRNNEVHLIRSCTFCE